MNRILTSFPLGPGSPGSERILVNIPLNSDDSAEETHVLDFLWKFENSWKAIIRMFLTELHPAIHTFVNINLSLVSSFHYYLDISKSIIYPFFFEMNKE